MTTLFSRALRCVTALAMLVSVLPGAEAAAAAAADLRRDPSIVADGWIVELAPGVLAAEVPSIALGHGVLPRHTYSTAMRGFAFSGSEASASELADDPRVRSVEPDLVVTLAEHKKRKWRKFERRLRVPWAWHVGHRGSRSMVAILDTGIANHPFLKRIHWKLGRNCAGDGGGAWDHNGHGTRTAGNVRSVARGVKLVPVRVFPKGSAITSLSNLMCGVDHVTKLNTNNKKWDDIDVATMSLAMRGRCRNASAYCGALKRSTKSGTVYVVAAGNAGSNAAGYLPASHHMTIAVSALSGPWSKGLASFSNWGSKVDLTAPGVNIRSPVPGGGWTRATGTSRSAPLVAGAAAIVKAHRPNAPWWKVRKILLKTGRCPNGKFNWRKKHCPARKGRWGNDPDGKAEPVPDAFRAGKWAS